MDSHQITYKKGQNKENQVREKHLNNKTFMLIYEEIGVGQGFRFIKI